MLQKRTIVLYRLKFNKTRFVGDGQSLLYASLGKGDGWSIFHMDKETDIEPHRVGPIYQTKAELLGDLTRYAKEFGFKA